MVQRVRGMVSDRDGDCRLQFGPFGPCEGESEWAHLTEHQRWETRGMPPEIRHTTAGTCKLCTRHHRLYDAHRIFSTALSKLEGDGPMRWDSDLGEFLIEQ